MLCILLWISFPFDIALVCTEARKVVFTDIHVPALHNIQHNINLNLSESQRLAFSLSLPLGAATAHDHHCLD
jgi:hypothetical protein